MLLRPFNCLILDEPTNHLDMKSKAVLTEAIKNFPGTVVVVSHDRDFLDPIVTKVIDVRKGGIRTFLGNVSYYLESTEAERAAALENQASATPNGKLSAATGAAKPADTGKKPVDNAKRLAPLKKKSEELEKRIATLETANASREKAMLDPAFFQRGAATKTDMDAYDAAKRELETANAEWNTLVEEIAGIEAGK